VRSPEDPRIIREDDVETRTIQRRTFLGRFGAAAGIAGILGFAMGCENTDSCDSDSGDSVMGDSDQTDPEPSTDSDAGDPCDTDGV
jgi:hypothetical protein